MFISKMKVATRIMLVISLISAVMLFVGAYDLKNVAKINSHVDGMYTNGIVPSQDLAKAAVDFGRVRVNLDKGLIDSNISSIKTSKEMTDQLFNQMESSLNQYQATGLTAGESKGLANIQLQLSTFKSDYDIIWENCLLNTTASKSAAFAIVRNHTTPIADKIDSSFDNLWQLQAQDAQQTKQLAANDYNDTRNISIIVLAIALLAAFCLGYMLSRSISKPLGELAGLANEIADGDLRRNVQKDEGKDEISTLSRCVHQMANNLRDFISHIQNNAHTVASSSEQLSANAQETSSAANETGSTVTEIAATMEQVAQNSQTVAALSEDASKEAQLGSKDVDKITAQMTIIESASTKASTVVDTLSKTLNQVNQIVDLITNIADQTNLLALNAAIEAARAGDQGRGFAVVADEVRKLAEQSGHAAKDINQLIVQVLDESQRAVQAMAEGSKQVQEGAVVANEAGTRFKGILNLINDLTEEIQSVAAASEQVSAGVQSVASTTEEQVAAMEEVSAATQQLSGMANDLNALVAKYQL